MSGQSRESKKKKAKTENVSELRVDTKLNHRRKSTTPSLSFLFLDTRNDISLPP